jgi:hypothetical protein
MFGGQIAPETVQKIICCPEIHRKCTLHPQLFHSLTRVGPARTLEPSMKVLRPAGVLLFCLSIGGSATSPSVHAADVEEAVKPVQQAPLFRVFLKDGTTLVSYGELARVGDRVVFSMPTSASMDNPNLHLVDIASDRVDWARTTTYAESARATRYLETRAETDYTILTTAVAQALNDVATTTDPVKRLGIVERARRRLAEWPPTHYNYKQSDVRQMLGMLDEVIADLRAATGAQRFDLNLVAIADTPPALEPLLPAPGPQETIEQTLAAASLTDSPAERTSLLAVAVAAIDRDAAFLPVVWAAEARASATAAIARELEIDRVYRRLETEMLRLANERARAADVRGVQQLFVRVKESDEALGGYRPDEVNAIVAVVQERLDAARRLRLERDRWAIRLPELRAYREAMSGPLQRFTRLSTALEDIKGLTGSGPDALGAILKVAADIQKVADTIHPPDELRDLHSLVMSATLLAQNAAKLRREAALTGDMARAWDASSAAAGALMLSDRVRTEMQSAFRLPQLPR